MPTFDFSAMLPNQNTSQLPINALPDDSLTHLHNTLVRLYAEKRLTTEELDSILDGNYESIFATHPFIRESVLGARGVFHAESSYWGHRYTAMRLYSGQESKIESVAEEMEAIRFGRIAESIRTTHTILTAAGDQVNLPTVAGRLTDDNVNQQTRMEALAARPAILAYFTQILSHLTAWCQSNSYQWHIRPPVSFPSRHYQQLRHTAPLRGIQNDWMYLSPAMASTIDSLPPPMKASITYSSPIELLEQFRFWDRCHGFAVLKAIDKQDDTAPRLICTSHDMSPLLLGDCIDWLPVNLSTGIAMHTPFDRIAVNVNWAPDDGPYFIEQALIRLKALKGIEHAGAMLHLLCALMSIMASTVKTGKGFSKPSWVHSPINTTMIRTTVLLAREYAEGNIK